MTRQLIGLFSLLTWFLFALPCASAVKYKITDLGSLGGPETKAFAINNKGQVVGEAMNPKGQTRAFLWQKGKMTSLGTFGGDWSAATDINDHEIVLCEATFSSEQISLLTWDDGEFTEFDWYDGIESECMAINDDERVVGCVEMTDGSCSACYWDNGEINNFGSVWEDTSSAFDINNKGEIIGYQYDSSGEISRVRSFIRRRNKVTDLGMLPGMYSSVAISINEESQVVGYCYPKLQSERTQGFIWEHGKMKSLNAPNGKYGIPQEINNKGMIVGASKTTDGKQSAVLWEKGQMIDINSLIPKGSGWKLTIATSVNDLGQIVGYGDYKEQTRAFLLTPVR